MNKNILALLIICLAFGSAHAQDSAKVTYGIRLGVNNAGTTRSASFDETNPPKMQRFTSYTVTVVVDVPLISVLSVQPGLSLTEKGQEKSLYNSGNHQQYRVTYLELPVNIVYKYKNFFGGAGAYAARALKGTYKYGSEKSDLKLGDTWVSAGSRQNDDWEQYDWGLSALLGYKYRRFSVIFQYDLGLKDIDPNPYYKSKTRTGSLQLGFSF